MSSAYLGVTTTGVAIFTIFFKMHDFQDFLFLIREDIDLRGGGSKEVKRCRTNVEYIFPPEGLDRGADLRHTEGIEM